MSFIASEIYRRNNIELKRRSAARPPPTQWAIEHIWRLTPSGADPRLERWAARPSHMVIVLCNFIGDFCTAGLGGNPCARLFLRRRDGAHKG